MPFVFPPYRSISAFMGLTLQGYAEFGPSRSKKVIYYELLRENEKISHTMAPPLYLP